MASVLVTGGAGYIGSHTCVELLNAGYDVIVIDNLSNSKSQSLDRVMKITGKKLKFYKGDILDKDLLVSIFTENKIDAVIHFAGLKCVPESVRLPLDYFHNNLTGTINLLQVMRDFGTKRMVFSSSATVYGVPETVPLKEDFPLGSTSPYGRTKLIIEDMLRDLYRSDSEWGIALLRYFNPIGAHKSGRIGEDPNGIPNNLMPNITQVAIGRSEKLKVCGDDYPTPDGTCVRDYIHVVDLAKGHLKALEKIFNSSVCEAYNLGTGKGYSVLEIVRAFEKASGVKIPFEVTPRRPGDIPASYADPSKAQKELHWKAELGIEEMCEDVWRWQKNNPKGYED